MVPSQCPQMVCCTYLFEEDVVFSVCGHNRPSQGCSHIYHCHLVWRMYLHVMAGADAILADRVRAHDTRAVSFSWPFLNGASLKEIQQAAFCSNPNSFISCYL